ncbi:unnamed protein product [Closterium sp. NIES-54]
MPQPVRSQASPLACPVLITLLTRPCPTLPLTLAPPLARTIVRARSHASAAAHAHPGARAPAVRIAATRCSCRPHARSPRAHSSVNTRSSSRTRCSSREHACHCTRASRSLPRTQKPLHARLQQQLHTPLQPLACKPCSSHSHAHAAAAASAAPASASATSAAPAARATESAPNHSYPPLPAPHHSYPPLPAPHHSYLLCDAIICIHVSLEFPSWLIRAERFLKSQRQDNDTLWAHASGDLPEPPSPLDLGAEPNEVTQACFDKARTARSVWQSRDAAACIALSSLLPETEEAHFSQSALKDIESNIRSVASTSGTVVPLLFKGCTVPQLPTFTASLASTVSPPLETAAVSTAGGRSRGKGGKRGGRVVALVVVVGVAEALVTLVRLVEATL